MSKNENAGDSAGASSELTPAGVTSAEDVLASAQRALTTIESLVERAKAAAASAADSQSLIAAALTDAQSKLVDIAGTATQAVAARTQINDEQAVIATKSDHIQKAQEHADRVRAELDRTLTAAKQQATETEGHKARAQSSADSGAQLFADLRGKKGEADNDAAAIEAALQSAKESASTSKKLADKATVVEERIAAYEGRLAELDKQCAAQLATITGLLPGATSAGLAHAFDQRRQTFLKPSTRWQILFVGSVVVIALLALTGLWHVYTSGGTLDYNQLLLIWLSRLPVAGALVWLALHSSREAALAKRLEEDYGYKAAIASSFLGFHRQMSEVGAAAASNAPLAKLCEDTLTTIASPPGRIYDKHKLIVSPATELKDAAVALTDVARNVAATR